MTEQTTALTRGLMAGIGAEPTHRSVVPALYPTSTYVFDHLGAEPAYDYSRAGNPTRDLLGEALATLEGGAGATVTASGMAAILLVVDTFVGVGGRVVAPHDCYGGTWRLLDAWHSRGRIRCDFVDLTDPEAVRASLATPAELVLIETPSNPLMRITDVRMVGESAHAAGALVAVDSTIASPVVQRPLSLGADLVVHSTTKYLNGHSDVVGGAVVAADPVGHGQLRHWAKVIGVTGSPWDAWLTLRGLRTLDARMRVHQSNAGAVADLLGAHPAVTRVHYPGLASHPQHELARSQQTGFGGLVSFELAGGPDAVRAFTGALRLFELAESLGGVESLVAHPASMTHAGMSAEAKASAGVVDSLLRLSVGIEAEVDLCADLARGLAAAAGS